MLLVPLVMGTFILGCKTIFVAVSFMFQKLLFGVKCEDEWYQILTVPLSVLVQLLGAAPNEYLECRLSSIIPVILAEKGTDKTAAFSQIMPIEFFAIRIWLIATSHM